MALTSEQIKQTVVEIRERHFWGVDEKTRGETNTANNEKRSVLQKLIAMIESLQGDIAYRDADISNLLNKLAGWRETYDRMQKTIEAQAETIAANAKYAIELQGKISEQAAEIYRLKKRIRDIDPEREP